MKVIILVGLPGSGKTTLCESFPEYKRISQDDLGDRKACIAKFHEYVGSGHDVIIDRTNVSRKQRAIWTDLASSYSAETICIYIHINEEECIHRIMLRKNHPTIKESMDSERKRAIVYLFHKDLEIPDMSENLGQILMVRG